MNEAIENFIGLKRLAVVGVSRDTNKFGTRIFQELKQRGYQVTPVNPHMKDIGGQPCAPDLAALKDKVDGAVVCVSPKQVEAVLLQASASGIKHVWLQQGAESPAALKAGKDLSLDIISGKCILMYAEPVQSFHKFHRLIAKVFGQL
jgi:predicted CoA-binding protein